MEINSRMFVNGLEIYQQIKESNRQDRDSIYQSGVQRWEAGDLGSGFDNQTQFPHL